MLLIEGIEAEYLADRAGIVTASLMSGAADVEPPQLSDRVDEFDAALVAPPKVQTARDLSNQRFLHAIGGAA